MGVDRSSRDHSSEYISSYVTQTKWLRGFSLLSALSLSARGTYRFAWRANGDVKQHILIFKFLARNRFYFLTVVLKDM